MSLILLASAYSLLLIIPCVRVGVCRKGNGNKLACNSFSFLVVMLQLGRCFQKYYFGAVFVLVMWVVSPASTKELGDAVRDTVDNPVLRLGAIMTRSASLSSESASSSGVVRLMLWPLCLGTFGVMAYEGSRAVPLDEWVESKSSLRYSFEPGVGYSVLAEAMDGAEGYEVDCDIPEECSWSKDEPDETGLELTGFAGPTVPIDDESGRKKAAWSSSSSDRWSLLAVGSSSGLGGQGVPYEVGDFA